MTVECEADGCERSTPSNPMQGANVCVHCLSDGVDPVAVERRQETDEPTLFEHYGISESFYGPSKPLSHYESDDESDPEPEESEEPGPGISTLGDFGGESR